MAMTPTQNTTAYLPVIRRSTAATCEARLDSSPAKRSPILREKRVAELLRPVESVIHRDEHRGKATRFALDQAGRLRIAVEGEGMVSCLTHFLVGCVLFQI